MISTDAQLKQRLMFVRMHVLQESCYGGSSRNKRNCDSFDAYSNIIIYLHVGLCEQMFCSSMQAT